MIEKMKDKIILIAGGTSTRGFTIVRYFLEKGATVIVPAKSLDEITKLRADTIAISNGKLVTELADLPDYDSRFDIAEAIVEKFGKIDIGISVFNNLSCKRQLTEAHINDWQNMVDNEVTPFFVSARLILNTMKLSNSGLYVSVCDSSMPEENILSPLSKIAANTKMEMSKIFAEETKKYNVRYYHLWIKNGGTANESTVSDGNSVQVLNAELIGEEIMKLYQRKTDKPDEVFQQCPEKTGL
jgi:NADP-dependent 3-hydroxy acid dehydrogenase YdfG